MNACVQVGYHGLALRAAMKEASEKVPAPAERHSRLVTVDRMVSYGAIHGSLLAFDTAAFPGLQRAVAAARLRVPPPLGYLPFICSTTARIRSITQTPAGAQGTGDSLLFCRERHLSQPRSPKVRINHHRFVNRFCPYAGGAAARGIGRLGQRRVGDARRAVAVRRAGAVP